jgi:hypothetical protein
MQRIFTNKKRKIIKTLAVLCSLQYYMVFLSSINERESKEAGITALAEGLERPALASLA